MIRFNASNTTATDREITGNSKSGRKNWERLGNLRFENLLFTFVTTGFMFINWKISQHLIRNSLRLFQKHSLKPFCCLSLRNSSSGFECKVEMGAGRRFAFVKSWEYLDNTCSKKDDFSKSINKLSYLE